MYKKIYNEFLLSTQDNKLYRFSYKENIGIYYEIIVSNKIINKNIIFGKPLKYFYIFEGHSRDINVIYQDLFGKVRLYVVNETSSKDKTLFYSKHNFITPINFKGIYLKNSIMFLYSLDNDNRIYFYNNINNTSKVIYNEKNDININYKVLSGKDFISLIIYSISFNMCKLIFKSYIIKSRIWSGNKTIFITKKPYIDISFCTTNNRVHSLIIINEENKKSLIYKYNDLDKEECIQRELIIYEDENISSCLIIDINNVIWLIWISKKNLYCCYSIDLGESFSIPSIYISSIKDNIRKIEFIDDGKNKEIYIREENGKVNLFLEELLKYNYSFNINHKEITYSSKDKKEISSISQEIKI